MTSVRFSRKPYTVKYRSIHDGEMHTIRRVPPPRLHRMLPTDIVSLKHKKSDDFPEGTEFSIKHINQKHPNTLQLVDDDGATTFVDHFDVNLEEEVALRDGVDPRDRPANNRYLLWP